MKMVDIKREKPKPPKNVKDTAPAHEPSFEEYPIRIRLEKQDLESLGLSPKDFNTKMSGEGSFAYDVIMVKDIERKDKDPWESPQCVELQITKLGLGGMAEKKPSKLEQALAQKNAGPGEE